MFDTLGHMLGTNWDKEQLEQFNSGGDEGPQSGKFILPLAYVIRPEIKETLTAKAHIHGKDYDEVEDLMDLDKDEFLKLMGK